MFPSSNRFKASIAAIFLAATAHAQAEVSVSITGDTEILAINGVAHEGPVQNLTLGNGANQLLARIRAEVKALGNKTELARSNAFVLEFEASNRQVELRTPRFRRRSDLDRFDDQPSWRLVDSAGGEIALRATALLKEGFQLNRDFEAELADFNRSRSAGSRTGMGAPESASAAAASIATRAAAQGGAVKPSPPMAPKSPETGFGKAENAEQNRALEMLKYWYQEAHPETRRKFQRWIAR